MTNFLGEGPLYVTGWQDSGPLACFCEAPASVALAALCVPFMVGLWARSWGLACFGGLLLLGATFQMGLFLPLEFWGWLTIITFVVAAVWLSRRQGRDSVPPLAAGGLILAIAMGLGFPRSYIFDPSRCVSNLKNYATALELWSTDHDGARPTHLDQLVPDYLPTLPACLETPYAYDGVMILCQNSLHQDIGRSPRGYPRMAGDGSIQTSPTPVTPAGHRENGSEG